MQKVRVTAFFTELKNAANKVYPELFKSSLKTKGCEINYLLARYLLILQGRADLSNISILCWSKQPKEIKQ